MRVFEPDGEGEVTRGDWCLCATARGCGWGCPEFGSSFGIAVYNVPAGELARDE